MAKFSIEFFSNSLVRPVSFEMFIPNDPRRDIPSEKNPYAERKTRTLFLLHGYAGSSENWGIDDLGNKYNFAMVMPSCENSFYLDGASTGHKYQTFVGEELVDYIRGTFSLAMSAEETGICGLSMGGYGALHTGFAYPDRFGKIGAMSSALIVSEMAQVNKDGGNPVANLAYYRECFGDLETAAERDVNPEVQIKNLKAAGKKIPDIYMCCGTEDFLLENNRRMHSFLESENVSHIYKESKGGHDPVFWNEYSRKIAEWMFE